MSIVRNEIRNKVFLHKRGVPSVNCLHVIYFIEAGCCIDRFICLCMNVREYSLLLSVDLSSMMMSRGTVIDSHSQSFSLDIKHILTRSELTTLKYSNRHCLLHFLHFSKQLQNIFKSLRVLQKFSKRYNKIFCTFVASTNC